MSGIYGTRGGESHDQNTLPGAVRLPGPRTGFSHKSVGEKPSEGYLVQCRDVDEIIAFGPEWDRLACAQRQYIPSFADAMHSLLVRKEDIRLVGWRVGDEIVALALFLVQKTVRRFWLGEKPVMKLPVLAAELYGHASVGSVDTAAAKIMLASIMDDRAIELVMFRDVPRTDPFYVLVANGAWRGPTSISHHRATRRLAQLPSTMAEYWTQLRPTTAKAGKRDWKMFERLNPTYTVMTRPDQAAEFLTRAARISDRTYQRKINVGIEDTPELRRHFDRLSSEGRLRGYIATVEGEDVAFAWGDISHGVFYYRTTGFDPAFARNSPGRSILLHMIRDLIESRAAHTFDFSGRDTDAKERFSTSSIECANFLVTRWSRARGVTGVGLDRAFNVPKTLAPRLLGRERLQRLRRALRR